MNKKYYWIKLKKEFFQNKEIKKLRRIKKGDTYIIIYLKMQLLSLETEGVLYYDSIEDDFAEEIALAIDENTENVKKTVELLQKYGLIQLRSKDEWYMPEVAENTGKETDSAQRMRRSRASQCDTNVQKCDTEKEIDKELEKEIDIDKDIERDKEKETEVKKDYERIEMEDEIIPISHIAELFKNKTVI